MLNFTVLIGVLIFSSSVFAEEVQKNTEQKKECVVSFERFQSPLKNDLLKFKQIQLPVRNPESRTIMQTAIMKNGEVLEFSGGGCEKLSYSITYSNVKISSGGVFENIPMAMRLLESSSMEDSVKQMFLSGLRKAKQKKSENPTELSFLCGGAQCSLIKEISKLKLTFTSP
jgi:hypothetical protein